MNESKHQIAENMLGSVASEQQIEKLADWLDKNNKIEMNQSGEYSLVNEDDANANYAKWLCELDLAEKK